MMNKLDFKKNLILAFSAIPLLIYAFMVVRYSVNIPHYDDYEGLLAFLNRLLDVGSFDGFLKLLFRQEADHIIALPKILALIDYSLFGNINFIHIIFLGNIALFSIYFLLLGSSEARTENRLAMLLPVPYLLFQLQYWEISTWALDTVQFFGVFFFTLLSLYSLNRKTKGYLVLAMVGGSIATFTAANGMFVWLVGVIFLFMEGRFKEAILWAVLSAALIFVYFSGYHATDTGSIVANAIAAVQHPFASLGLMFAALGNTLGFGLKMLSVTFGGGIFFWFVYLTFKKYYETNPVIYFFMLSLFITAVAFAVKRSYLGIDLILYTNRYRLVSTLMTVCTYISAVEIIGDEAKKLNFSRLILVFSVFFMIFSNILYLPFLSGRYNELKTGVNGLSLNTHQYAYQIIQEAAEKDTYHLPAGYLEKIDPNYKRDEMTKLHNFLKRFNARGEHDTTLILKIRIPHGNIFGSTIHVFLQKPAVIYLFNSGLTPTTIRELLHNVNPDDYKSELRIEKD